MAVCHDMLSLGSLLASRSCRHNIECLPWVNSGKWEKGQRPLSTRLGRSDGQAAMSDQTMHLRKSYDDEEAQRAMFRVRELMTTLSSKLSEKSIRKIPWSAWK
jgi:hypothetical protein